MFTSLKRVFQTAIIIFKRQGLLAFAMIFVLTIACLQVSSVFMLREVSRSLISALEEKIDVSVYLKEGTPEQDILLMREDLTQSAHVKDIEYVSSEQAREIFVQRHQNDPTLMESLGQVTNPFLASLNIKAAEFGQYEEIVGIIEDSNFGSLVEKVDFYERKPIIERIFAITSGVRKSLLVLTFIVAGIAVLIAFNTIRLAIYSLREEIEIERLVGASNWFIRGPFLAQGAISGFLAFLLSLSALAAASHFLSPQISALFPDFALFSCFQENISSILIIQFLTGIGLGVLASFIATTKYLKI